MNKHLYRIIFNKRRGQMMVVAENAGSPGKAASGEGNATGAFYLWSWSVLATALRPMCTAVGAALGMALLAAGPASAQVKADPNAPGNQRPTVLQTSNGTVLVNIQTPSAAGVSRNTYSQFDITANGAVLNNSRTDAQSHIGGWVQGNPWLATGSARVILNEVNSSDPSQLRGYIEVAGQRAEVIIANPSGVQVDGGGFINASRVTLTTGTAQLNNGGLGSYQVQGGTVTINGLGLDTTQADFTSILARALQVNAGIWAKDLRVVTGVNTFDAASGAAAPPEAGKGSAPAFALDVSHLGGMYAGKITLIGTESGLGARNAGVLAASSGPMVLDANGWLSNSGSVQANGQGANVSIATAGDITNSGTVYAAGDTNVASSANIAGDGMIAAQNNTTVQATGATSHIDFGAGAVIAAGMNADGSLAGAGALRMGATHSAALHGTGAAAGNIDIQARALNLTGARVFGDQLLLRASDGDLDASTASVNAQGSLTFGAMRTLFTDTARVTADSVSIAAHDISNIGGQILQFGAGDLTLALPGTLDNTSGQISSNSGSVTLDAATLVNTGGAIEHAGRGSLDITATTVRGPGGRISSNGSLTIAATDIDHRGAGMAAQQIVVVAASLDNSAGTISQTGTGEAVLLLAGSLRNMGGTIASGGDASISAGSLQNGAGRISAAGDTFIGTAGIDNTGGVIVGGGKLAITGANVDNSGGSLQALGGDATLRFGDLSSTGGSVYASGNLDTVVATLDNGGSMYAVGDVSLRVSGGLANSGVIAARGNTTIIANTLAGVAGGLLGAGVRADGGMALSGDLIVSTAAQLASHGQNLAAGKAVLTGAAVDVSNSQTSAASIALSAASGSVTSAGATVATTGTLTVTASGSLANAGGTLCAGQLVAQVANLDNTQGTIIQTGSGDLALTLKTLDNKAGRIAVNSTDLTLRANTLINTGGAIEHAGAGKLDISAATLNGVGGTINGNGALNIDAGTLAHDGATTSGRTVSIQAGSLSNRGGHLLQSGEGGLALAVTGTLDNAAGEIASSGLLMLHAGAIENSYGRITSGASAGVNTQDSLSNVEGVLAASHALTVAAQALDNSRGMIQAASDKLTVNTASLINTQGTLTVKAKYCGRVLPQPAL